MIKGSCLCGAIQYEVDDIPERMNICHCSMCRKITGSAYGVFAHIRSTNFKWVQGESTVSHYESSPQHDRAFCPRCGSSVPNSNEAYRDYTCIPAGTLDTDPRVKPMLQIFTGSKAPWHDLASEPISYEEFDPD